MKTRTVQHLSKADTNAQLAYRLAGGDRPSDWSAVVAFYAAVHYVGAVLWEQGDYSPNDHSERRAAIHRTSGLRDIEEVYDRLQDVGHKVRYLPNMKLASGRFKDALGDMAEIRTAVFNILGVK